MDQLPLLRLWPARIGRRDLGRPQRPPSPSKPSHPNLVSRHSAIFNKLELGLLQAGDMTNDPSALAPERVVVFEVSDMTNFGSLAARLGLDFLGEEESEVDPDDDFFFMNEEGGKSDKKLPSYIYLALPTQQALNRLLSYWKQFEAGQAHPDNMKGLWDFFGSLITIRPWGAKDRIDEDDLDFFANHEQDLLCRVEIELWFSGDRTQRIRDLELVKQITASLGGRIIDAPAPLEPIRYSALLVDIPGKELLHFRDYTSKILKVEPVFKIRPQSLICFSHDPIELLGSIDEGQSVQLAPPVAALLDAVPMQQHPLLKDRLIIDDWLGLESQAQATERYHGTAMASLILHGDLNAEEDSIRYKLLVLPVMHPLGAQSEGFPKDKLAVDTIYQALLRIATGEHAESIVIINHALANAHKPFSGIISGWARLLDYMSYTYNLLIITAAGNIITPIQIAGCSYSSFEDATPEVRKELVYKALQLHRSQRTLLSPAEAINPLTIGAWHEDNVELEGPLPSGRIDPYPNSSGPSVASATGFGHRKSIKPEVFFPGGRNLLTLQSTNPFCCVPCTTTGKLFGLKAAAPPRQPGRLGDTALNAGTSSATALATRHAIQLYDFITESEKSAHASPEDKPRHTPFHKIHIPPLLKALIVHSSEWGEAGDLLKSLQDPDTHWSKQYRDITRLIGYGATAPARVLSITQKRVILYSFGTIHRDKKHILALPLPSSLSGTKHWRKLTTTLAWTAPINPQHRKYRRAKLELRLEETILGVSQALQPPKKQMQTGTVFHSIYEGSTNKRNGIPPELELIIECRNDAGVLDEPVPYAVVITLEVSDDSDLNIYSEVQAALRLKAKIPVRPRA